MTTHSARRIQVGAWAIAAIAMAACGRAPAEISATRVEQIADKSRSGDAGSGGAQEAYNPTCRSLGYINGYKPQPEPPASGSYTSAEGYLLIAIESDGTFFSWTANQGVDAVIVKGGPSASVYVYDPPAESRGDDGLSAPENPGTGEPYELSHIEFCYDREYPDQDAGADSHDATIGIVTDLHDAATHDSGLTVISDEFDAGSKDAATAEPDAARPDAAIPDAAKPDTNGPSCVPQTENCFNGADDDCDGAADCWDPDCAPICFVNCTNFEGNNCNSDDGHGEYCDPAYNTNGCGPERFFAWCNRRNAAYGCPEDGNFHPECIWEVHLFQWVRSRCDAFVAYGDFDGNGSPEYVCRSTANALFFCQTPLVINLHPAQPVRFAADDQRSAFNLAPAGAPAATRTDWPTAATPWLALDRDGDGKITSGAELFGSATPIAGGRASNGFAALAALDDNGDGVVDLRDRAFARLVVWTDANADRISQSDEMAPLASLGIESLPTQYFIAQHCDNRGNCERERAAITWRDRYDIPREAALIDVHLVVHPTPVESLLACVQDPLAWLKQL